jgi:hypothetical protein
MICRSRRSAFARGRGGARGSVGDSPINYAPLKWPSISTPASIRAGHLVPECRKEIQPSLAYAPPRSRPSDRFSAVGYALRCAFMPLVDHRSSYQFRSLTGTIDDFSRTFDVCGMNRYGPFASLDPSADRVSNPPVLHLKAQPFFWTTSYILPEIS